MERVDKKVWSERNKDKVISMKILFFVLSLFVCSISLAKYHQFQEVRECGYGTFWFYDDDHEDGYDKGHYHFVNGFGAYEKIYKSSKYLSNDRIEERGIYDAHQTQDEYLTTEILITIKESTIPERIGASFICQFWYREPRGYEYCGSAYFTNAKQLTCGIATSDTILTTCIPISKVESNATWANIKRLFQTK